MKKGFTLIELLAVIVILAIITLIAVPMILGVVETAKIGAAESSATGYVKAVEHSFINNLFIGGSYDGEYDVIDNELGVKIKGTGPSKGFFVVENNEVKYGEFCINGYGIKYENSISKYSPDEVTCDGNNEIIFVEPEGEEITKLCNGEINYDEVTNFKVKTVEDLVCVSKLSSEGKTFEGKKIMLLSNIDINDNNSYVNINDTTYGDINGNGIIEGIKVELTTEKGFLPIGSSRTPFKGTFEGYTFTLSNIMINRPNDDYVGLFGCNKGTIIALNVEGINVKGNNYVGGIAGQNSSGGTIREITYKGTVEGNQYVGGIAGHASASQIDSILAKESNVIGNSLVGGMVGYTSNSITNITGVYESGKVNGSRVISNNYKGIVLISDAVEANNTQGITYTKYEDILSGYDGGLDTWIGGDNDNSGYYFDYDERGEIVLRNIEQYPITFNLKGEGTEEKPYLINTVKDWNEATTKVTGGYYFKINNDLDFTGKRFYAMGTAGNHFIGTIDGNNKTIKNITMTGTQNSGVIGYNEGTIKNLNIENVNIKTYAYSGIIGYNTGIIQNLNVKDITVNGVNDSNGGVVGYNIGTLKEIEVQNITVNGNNYIGGIIGYNKGTILALNVEGINVKGNNSVGGIAGQNSSGGTIREITYKGTVEGNQYVGGIAGHASASQIDSILAKESNVIGNSLVGGMVGFTSNSSTNITGVYESGKVNGSRVISNNYKGIVLISDAVEANNTQGVTYTKYEDILSGYDGALDTWIGGDNDNSGYYFDYNERGEIVLRNIEQYPITFNLKGEGTEEKPYLINTVKDWNEATTKVTGGYYFKINNDLDFTGKRFYAMGTSGNHFIGTIDGNNKTIKNITMTGTQNSGVIGYNEGTIKNLNIENVNIKTYAYSGIIGYNTGTIQNLNVKDITVNGVNNNNGGIAGYNTGTLKETEVQNITVSGNENIGGITGYNKGTIIALNVKGINVKGNNNVGGIAGQNSSGTIREITYKGTVEGNQYVGGIAGYASASQIDSILVKESNVKGNSLVGGMVGFTSNSSTNITGVYESGKVNGSRVISNNYKGIVLISDAVEANNTQGTTYTSDDINNLGYYSSVTYNDKPILESATTGDVDESGYYFAYGNDGYIKVVKVGETTNIIAGLYPIDDNYTMSSIVGTTDTTSPTCELHYVRAVTNGIQASFSCTDDSGAPTVKSLFDSTASKSATTFDAIGTTKSGSISGNTKTVVSTWNTYNTISQPTPGTCYYFRYGAQDIEGNFSTYVTDLCYTGFSS